MKLPFSGKFMLVKGVLARLNPGALMARLKRGKKVSATSRDEDDPESNIFEGLGDLDVLDAAANAADAPPAEGEDAPDDSQPSDETHQEAPDSDDVDEDGGEEHAEIVAKTKKLLLFGTLAVVVALLLGAGVWMVLGGGDQSVPSQVQKMPPGTVVLNLDNVPYAQSSDGAKKPVVDKSRVTDKSTLGTSIETPATSREKTLAQLGLAAQQKPGEGLIVPAMTSASFANLRAAPKGQALGRAPIDILVEQAAVGPLPRIAEDGQMPYRAYARPPAALGKKPRVAVVVTGVGLSRAATEAALNAMPQNVSLALDVYAGGLDFWVAQARKDGHEVLLSVPLEAENFPLVDPGPDMLKTLNAPADNLQKLDYVLSRTTGYFAVLADFGSRFLKNEEQLRVMMKQVKARGLMYVDGGAKGSLGPREARKQKVPWAAVDMNLDAAKDAQDVDRALAAFETLAKNRKAVLLRTSATPLRLQRLSVWLRTLAQKGLVLVPVSALANTQSIR